MIKDEVLCHWWGSLNPDHRRLWLAWHPADAVPEELVQQLRDYFPRQDLTEFAFRLSEPDTGEAGSEWLATDRLAAAIEAQRAEGRA